MFRNGLFNTGPESAGAEPGPTCYRYFSLLVPQEHVNGVPGRVVHWP